MTAHVDAPLLGHLAPRKVRDVAVSLAGVIAAAIAIVAILFVSWPNTVSPVDLAMLGCIAAVLTFMASRLRRETPGLGWANPGYALIGFLTIVYLLKPIYDFSQSTIGTVQLGQVLRLQDVHGSVTRTLVTLTAAVALLCFGFTVAPIAWSAKKTPAARVLRASWGARLFVAFAVALLGAAWLAKDLLSFQSGVFAGLTSRHLAFAGDNFVLIPLLVFKAAAITVIATDLEARSKGEPRNRRVGLNGALITACVVFDLIRGERAALVIGDVLLFGAMYTVAHRQRVGATRLTAGSVARKRRGRVRSVVFIVLAVSAYAGYRSYVRDSRGTISASAFVGEIANLPQSLLSGGEAAAFDDYWYTRRNIPSTLPYRRVAGVEAVLLAPVPSRLAPGKPERGSVILTQVLAPVAASHEGNIAFSAAADLHLIDGTPAVLVGYFLIGVLLGLLVRIPLSRGITPLNVGASFYMLYVGLGAIRSDTFSIGIIPFTVASFFVGRQLVSTRCEVT